MALNHAAGIVNYNIYGNQHNYNPYKDKTHLDNEPIRHAKWLEPPQAVRSRSELQQARHRGRVPDRSYDFDGDGVVGNMDMFIGRQFNKDCSGRLTTAEKRQAEAALANGFMDKYVQGLDQTGDATRGGRGFYVTQKRGVVQMADNTNEISSVSYRKHHNADKVPPHATQTALELSRKAEMKGYGNANGQRWAKACAPVREPQPPNAQTDPRTCEVAHIRERAEADGQAARYRAGLLPMNTEVNPERQNRTVGLGWDASPVIATRSQLCETRKELMKRDCEDLRAKGEEHFAPLSVRNAQQQVLHHEFRRPDPGYEPRTLTSMKDERRRAKIEYDLANFAHPQVLPSEYPRFSDRPDVPFWGASSQAELNPTSARSPQMRALQRTVSEPAFKATETPWRGEARDVRDDIPQEAIHTALAHKNHMQGKEYASKTVKRFTTDYLEHGQGRNKPRIFSNIQPVPVGPRDLESLELSSSLEPIRNAALMRQAEERKKSRLNPKSSILWQEAENGARETREKFEEHEEPKDNTKMNGRSPAQRAPVFSSPDMTVMDVQKEPRFYGSPTPGTAKSMTSIGGRSGVRCGGFQKLDWIPPPGERTFAGEQTGRPRSRGRSMSLQKPADAH
jgi:hypothetical protein